MRIDIAIIGAGPSGLITATKIAESGHIPHVFEEHQEVGLPNHCAGIVSIEGMKKLNIEPDNRFYQNTIYGGRVYAPSGNFVEIRDKNPRAYVIKRDEFDKFLKEKAVEREVKIHFNQRVTKLLTEKQIVKGIKTKQKTYETKLVINATGAGSRLLSNEFTSIKQSRTLTGLNIELDNVNVENDMVEVWLNSDIAKGLFAWVIPINENTVRCGLGTTEKNASDCLKKFVERRFNIKIDKGFRGGLICTGGPVNKTVFNGLLSVGDSAGQVKPTTGGGVIIGGLCSLIAGKIAVKAIENNDFTNRRLSEYEREWRSRFWNELKVMLAARNLANMMSNKAINTLVKSFNESNLDGTVKKLIEEGDMDMQSGFIKKALRNPKILGILVKSVGKTAISEIFQTIE